MTMPLLKTVRLYTMAIAIGCAAALPISAVAADFITTSNLASKGDASAQYNLGVSYDDGEGVRQSKIQAKEWFGKSCDNGNQKGCDYYRIIHTS